MSTSIDGKPKVLALMPPVGAGEEYMADFQKHYILDVSFFYEPKLVLDSFVSISQ